MNSSGIKRGLAASAVAALAVAGLPFLASSASAAANDTLSVLSQGPIRNTNAAGGTIVLKSSSPDLSADGTGDNLRVSTAADYSNSVAFNNAGTEFSSSAFDLNVLGVTLLDGNTDGDNDPLTGSLKFADGSYHYNAQVAITLGTATSVTFGLIEDAAPTGLNASDPKTQVTVTPTGAPTQVDISTSQPGGAVNVPVPMSVEAKDAAGNTTQLIGGETFNLSGTDLTFANVTAPATPITTLGASALGANGKASLLVTSSAGGNKTATIAGSGAGTPSIATSVTDSQSITILEQADITTDEFKFDTGADTWVDGTTAFGGTTKVRVDQNSVTFSFASKDTVGEVPENTDPDDANKVVILSLANGTSGIFFNGKDPDKEATGALLVPVVLGADGKGSTTVTLSNVVENATWTFGAAGSNIATTTVSMERPAAAAATVKPDATTYVTKVGSPTTVVVSVKDQFGNPVTGNTQVAVTRAGNGGRTANDGTTARQTVGTDGKATFTLPDAGTTAGTEGLTFKVYDDQFDTSAVTATATSTINYTATGLGADISLAKAHASSITPLYDATATLAATTDVVDVTINGGTDGSTATVTVDNGALVLSSTETTLDKGSASDTVTLTAGADSFRVVGTKAGTVNVTVTAGGKTATTTVTVTPSATTTQARNVAITGPAKAKAGEVAVFDVTVTDAFGNPVPGVLTGGATPQLGFVVSGPGNVQSYDAATNAGGVVHVNVLLTDNANSAVSLRVTGTGSQFGSKANFVGVTPAPGLTASVDTATASIADVVNIAELQAAVDAAQAKVDAAQDALDAANDELSVAKTEKQVANSNVKAAKKDLKAAKKKHKGVKAAQAALRNAKGDYEIASSKVTAANAKVTRSQERLDAANADLEAAKKALEDAQKS